MLIERDQLCSLIPHDGDMCLLDAIISWDEKTISCVAKSHRDPSNPLRKNNRLNAVHLLEYGAQAMAVHGGLLGRIQENMREPKFLVALRDAIFEVERIDTIEGDIKVEANALLNIDGGQIYEFNVLSASQVLCSARATVMSPKEKG